MANCLIWTIFTGWELDAEGKRKAERAVTGKVQWKARFMPAAARLAVDRLTGSGPVYRDLGENRAL